MECHFLLCTIYLNDIKLRQSCVSVTFLSLTDDGKKKIEFIHVSEKALIAINVNVDESASVDGKVKKREQVLLFGMYDIPQLHCHCHITGPLSGLSFRISGDVDSIQCIRPASLLKIREGKVPRDRRS